MLADAYLASGETAEGLAIAEDLAAAHGIGHFRLNLRAQSLHGFGHLSPGLVEPLGS